MKTRSEIIRALIEPAIEKAKENSAGIEEMNCLLDIHDLADSQDPDDLSKLIFCAGGGRYILDGFGAVFRSIIAITQDELMTTHRKTLRERVKFKKDVTHAWLVEYLASEQLADIIEREVDAEGSET